MQPVDQFGGQRLSLASGHVDANVARQGDRGEFSRCLKHFIVNFKTVGGVLGGGELNGTGIATVERSPKICLGVGDGDRDRVASKKGLQVYVDLLK